MSKRTDINRIMIIGSGPITIGQACEFDYSGTQACKILRNEGYEVILINSNPATIMTDSGIASKIYTEPIISDFLVKIIEAEKPDAILPSLGGQTGLNSVLELHKIGILDEFNIEIIGTSIKSIEIAESRSKFKKAMLDIQLKTPVSTIVNSVEEAINITKLKKIKFPLIVRSSYSMGGTGSGIAKNLRKLEKLVKNGLKVSPISQVILEEFLFGWKEYELELVIDKVGNISVICPIENVDPTGIHTGDSISVAPTQTISDKEYQNMRNASINIMKKVKIRGGGANVQFAINSKTGEMLVIEMNPRVSRSSALASKATGYPIAKIVTQLAIGYKLDEIKNEITKKTLACFEPTLDYCVVKIPIWELDKFPKTDIYLSPMMKSVGETMAIGRTFKEAIQKAIRSLGTKASGFGITLLESINSKKNIDNFDNIKKNLTKASYKRILDIYTSFHFGIGTSRISKISGIDKWFILQLHEIFKSEVTFTKNFYKKKMKKLRKDLFKIKNIGFSDKQIANLINCSERNFCKKRLKLRIIPAYKSVDSCGAEFFTDLPYFYSTYESECDIPKNRKKKKIVILGSGPNRIGQGIEFDYCCVHASLSLKKEGIKSIIVNTNPETVSTDCDVSNKLFFDPLTYEDVMNIILKEKPLGIIIQFGGQIPIILSNIIQKSGINILGTKAININWSENRKLFQKALVNLGLNYPKSCTINSVKEAVNAIDFMNFPLIIRPSFVLGGKAISIANNIEELINISNAATCISNGIPVIIDEFLLDSTEVDVDVLSDGKNAIICGIMQHVECAGIHSGDSTSIFPPQNIKVDILHSIKKISKTIAIKFKIIGFVNIQYAIKNKSIYLIEVNPRASRTIPFISKVRGLAFVNYAIKILLGQKTFNIKKLDLNINKMSYVHIKESVFPFEKLLDEKIYLGPSMKSTGEVIGTDRNVELAYVKSQIASGQNIPIFGSIIVDYDGHELNRVIILIKNLKKMNFEIIMEYNKKFLRKISTESIINFCKFSSILRKIKRREINILISINKFGYYNQKSCMLRRTALDFKVPYFTTTQASFIVCKSIESLLYKKSNITREMKTYK